jgi:hypothetical protein
MRMYVDLGNRCSSPCHKKAPYGVAGIELAQYHASELIALRRAPNIFRVSASTRLLVPHNLLVANDWPGDQFMAQLAVGLDQGTRGNLRGGLDRFSSSPCDIIHES